MHLTKMLVPSSADIAGNPYKLHQLIYAAFDHTTRTNMGRILFRVETTQGPQIPVYILSHTEPDWERLQNKGQLEGISVVSRTYNPRFNPGDRYYFQTIINPTKKSRNLEKVITVSRNDLDSWLQRKFNGAATIETADFRNLGKIEVPKCGSGTNPRFTAVQVSGFLRVADPAKLLDLIGQGIGREKSFGCGLVSLTPAC